MKSGLLLDRYIKNDGETLIDLKFNSRITVISGDSGTGKSFIYRALVNSSRAESVDGLQTACFNYTNVDFVSDNIRKCHGALIVIDNADIILSKEDRDYIIDDIDNQYIIFSRMGCDFCVRSSEVKKVQFKENSLRLV